MGEWTLTLYPWTWVSAAILVFVGGKLLQQGGRMYGEGKNWMPETFAGVACEIIVILGGVLALIEQNAQ